MTDLRYPIGQWQQPVSLSPEERTEAIEIIESTPAQLRRAVQGLSEEQIDTPYRPAGWTLRQVVHHLPDSHMNSYIRFKLGRTEEVPTVGVYQEAEWAKLADAQAPIELSLDLLEALHRRWVLVLRSFDDFDWSRKIQHPEVGIMRLDSLLSLYAWHGPHHIAHIVHLRERRGW